MTRVVRAVLAALLPVAILAGAGWIGWSLYAAGEGPDKSTEEELGVPVSTLTVREGSHALDVRASGTVVPARDAEVRAQVSGRLVELHESLDPGTFVAEGETLFRIEDADYRQRVAELRANVAQAEAALEQEKGRHEAAEAEWKRYEERLSGEGKSPGLALREPQLASARAELEAARARLARAEEELERTSFEAPFDAVIVESQAEIGELVNAQTRIARIVGTEAFRVRTAVPPDELPYVDRPGRSGSEGAAAVVRQHVGTGEVVREGRVIELLSDLEGTSRMARVVVEIDDPYGLDDAPEADGSGVPILLGAYVDVTIEGPRRDELVDLPRDALRGGDEAYVYEPDAQTLAVRELDVAWRKPSSVLVDDGLGDGDRVVVSPVSTPVEGMKLREVSNETQAPKPAPEGELGERSRQRPAPDGERSERRGEGERGAGG